MTMTQITNEQVERAYDAFVAECEWQDWDEPELRSYVRTAIKAAALSTSPAVPNTVGEDKQLKAAKAALDGYDLALKNREHGGLAAHRCVDALRTAFEEAGE